MLSNINLINNINHVDCPAVAAPGPDVNTPKIEFGGANAYFFFLGPVLRRERFCILH